MFSGLVYWHCAFSCATENEAIEFILILSILINNSYFQLNALKPGIYRFSGSASLLALSLFMCDRKRSCGGHVQLNTLTPLI